MLSERQTSLYTKEKLHYAEVHVSDALESHGIPDIYAWRINKHGKLIPKNDETPIENIIGRNNLIEEVEFQAFLKIQERAKHMYRGDYILWISPIHPVYYPDASKIIITRKEEGILINTAIVTSWDAMGSILIARELASLANLDPNIFKSTLDVRANPLFIDKEKEYLLGQAIENMLNKNSLEMIQNGQASAIKDKYMVDIMDGKHISLGKNPLSCPSAFKVFAGEDEYGSLEFKCPNEDCKKTITRERGKLVSNCPFCGCDVRCK